MFQLDVSALAIGEHVLYLQVVSGQPMPVLTYPFYRIPMVNVLADPEIGGSVSLEVVDTVCVAVAEANEDYLLVNWTNEGTVVSTNDSITITEDGTFIAHFDFNDVPELESSRLLVYPNPSKGKVFVKGEKAVQQCEVYDGIGTLLISTSQFPDGCVINLESLPSGTYLIRLVTDDGAAIMKVVKQ